MATQHQIRLLQLEHTECVLCHKPLGQDSRDLGYMFCHEHRKCAKCGTDLSVHQIKWCIERFIEDLTRDIPVGSDIELDINYADLELNHPNCTVLTHVGMDKDPSLSIRQSEYDYLNLIRLSVIPNLDLSQNTNEKNADIYSRMLVANMDFEALALHLSMLQACMAQVQIAIRQDKNFRKNYLAEREKERFDNARKEAATSSRPTSKSATDSEEVQLAAMVELHGLNPADRKGNLKILAKRNKTINDLMKTLKLTEPEAREFCDKNLVEGGVFKK